MAERLADKAVQDEKENPASLSMNPGKSVPRNKPHVKPPLKDVPMTRLLTYLVAGLGVLAAFYIWRVTVWASDAGGYWNLMTGTRATPAAMNPGQLAQMAADSAVKEQEKAGAGAGGARKGKAGGKKESIESQITRLADALGISPADLTSAIRPFLDPTVPNPNDPAAAAAAAAAAAGAEAAKDDHDGEPGLLGVVGEMVLD